MTPGAVYFNDCPREANIPIYLVVNGSVGVVLIALNMGEQIHKKATRTEDDGVLVGFLKTGKWIMKGSDNKALNVALFAIEMVLGLFLAAWFFVGRCTNLIARRSSSAIYIPSFHALSLHPLKHPPHA